MVTIKQIADMCGVSRGTVDRVLNQRGNVKPEKRDMILAMAKQLNYTPNPAGRALVTRKNSPTVGILLPAKGLPFFDDIIKAMRESAEKYGLFGLNAIWRMTQGYDLDEQCAALEELRPKINALIINPINDPRVMEQMSLCMQDGIFVVTVNNDIERADRNCYVGSDYRNGGQTAGALLRMLRPSGCRIGIVLGSWRMLGHRQRLEGFRSILEGDSRFSILDVQEDNDDDIRGYERVSAMLKERPDMDAIFFAASGGSYGGCRAIVAKEKEQDITVVAFDTVPGIVEMMRQGVVNAAIYQHPRQQGQRSMQLVYDYLINGIKPKRDMHIMKNDIRILQNV